MYFCLESGDHYTVEESRIMNMLINTDYRGKVMGIIFGVFEERMSFPSSAPKTGTI